MKSVVVALRQQNRECRGAKRDSRLGTCLIGFRAPHRRPGARRAPMILLLAAFLGSASSPAWAAPQQRLSDAEFQVDYSASGITAIHRVHDKYDTNYIARGAALGDLIVRYREAGQQQWKNVSAAEMERAVGQPASSVSYTIGVPVPTIAESSRPSASVRSFGLFALGRGPAPESSHEEGVPAFEWNGRKGTQEWVQYDFAKPEKVWSSEVYWVVRSGGGEPCALPKSWRLLYRKGNQWHAVAATTSSTTAADQFDRLGFAPVTTRGLRIEVQLAENATAGIFKWRINDQVARTVTPIHDLKVNERFHLQDGALVWALTLRNETDGKLEVGDLGLPLPFNERYVSNKTITYTRRVIQHSFIGGDGSFIFWMRADSEGPFLVMTPLRGTGLEYFNMQPFRGYAAYIHSAASATELRAKGRSWNLPNTLLALAPKGQRGDSAVYGFRFEWAQDYAGVRQVLYQQHLFDVNVVPGMTIPTDLSAMVSLHTQNRIRAIVPQYPRSTRVQYLGERGKDLRVYRVRFARLGENMLKVEYGHGLYLPLAFFVTQPLETLIQKRAGFIVSHEQHRNPAKWYNGLFSQWDMKNQVLRGPDNLGHLRRYMVACDDPILGKAEFIAEKNVFYPDPKEIAAVEYYIRHYVWGGLQETTNEKFPYAVYGIPNWKVNRDSPDKGPGGQEHVWRIYDYPHVFGMYYYMYRVAKLYPNLTHYLDASGYLERAFGTAQAFFTVPNELIHWPAYGTGTYDEVVIPDIIRALRKNGDPKQADWLEGQWQKKVEYFVNDKPDLFQSEYPFDSTGFESTEALAKYAMHHVIRPGENVSAGAEDAFQRSVSYQDAQRFLHEQIHLNVGDRGWLETAYYDLGSDYRGGGDSSFTLSYMSQMGGWAVLDYGLEFAHNPIPYLRLGYASYLSSWALVNAGTKASHYGYWYPGKNNDGGASGGFEPRPWGNVWFGNFATGRGPWWYSGEIDLGFTGALRTAATIVTRDPIFGLYAYGGKLERKKRGIAVAPMDGLRTRFHIFLHGDHVSILLTRDGFKRGLPVVFNRSLSRFAFTLENRTGDVHRTAVQIAGLPQGVYQVDLGKRPFERFASEDGEANRIVVPVRGAVVSLRFMRVGAAAQ
ncbi:MAG TPA: DUF5695 domain-containing protein [Candidatus Acidoferrales bacterium]|nr:DUF5695 domain-containing protein [Candidatus Acidoferrales bacterium]